MIKTTTNDAEHVRATGCAVIHVNTGAGCHLEADMLACDVQQAACSRSILSQAR